MTAVVGAPTSLAQTTTDAGSAGVQHGVAPTPRIVDLRVGEHASFDRVVVDVRGRLPRFTLGYVRRLYYDPSGAPVPLHGRRFLALSLTPATTRGPGGASVYTGPVLQQYRFPVLRGVALTGDFEAVVSFGIALRRHAHVSVGVLHSPNRIVIDLWH
jgi:hypothetical protein